VSNLGHNVPLILTSVFGVGTALAGLAGVIAGPVLTTFPGMALVLGSIVFVIVVIGGLGSLPGAFLASLLIGLLQSYAIAANVGMPDLLDLLGLEFPRSHPLDDLWTLNLAQIAPILPFLLLVLVLIFRPTGLMGKREQ
ncbi:MAG: branched-chain amino acid ABC transporter permease, partial [Gammaproteobacteria bacterium]|nr:branched-chain amino acid ABC transporter permease [Gammaproteobacteria bacterium]